MSIHLRFIPICLALAILPLPNTSRADLEYTAGSQTTNTVFAVAPGASINVPIYVRQFGATQDISGDGGLFSAAFLVQQTSTPSASDAIIAGFSPNAALFNNTNAGSQYSNTMAALFIDQSGPSTIDPAEPDPTTGLLLIGTVFIQTSPTIGSTVYSISDFDPATTQFTTYDGTNPNLDAVIDAHQPITFTITTATPEPTVPAIVASSLMVAARNRRPKRARRSKP